jgi:hypothetical protein
VIQRCSYRKALEGTLGGCINWSTCSIMFIAKNPTQLNLIEEFPRQHLPNGAIKQMASIATSSLYPSFLCPHSDLLL